MRGILAGSLLLMCAGAGAEGTEASCDAELAQRVFARCGICHRIDVHAGHGVGPNLHAILGRDIASHSGFDYSEALQAVEGKWTVASLDDFLSSPAGFAPGTTMGFGGLASERERTAIICLLGERGEPQ